MGASGEFSRGDRSVGIFQVGGMRGAGRAVLQETGQEPLDEQGDGKTVLTLRQFHPSKDRRDATIGFGAVELGYQTLGKLAEYLARG